MNILVFGPPGAGKGSVSVHIAKKYNIPHISTVRTAAHANVLRRPLSLGPRFPPAPLPQALNHALV